MKMDFMDAGGGALHPAPGLRLKRTKHVALVGLPTILEVRDRKSEVGKTF